MSWERGMRVTYCAFPTTSSDHAWRLLVIVGCPKTSFVIYFCVILPSISNFQCIPPIILLFSKASCPGEYSYRQSCYQWSSPEPSFEAIRSMSYSIGFFWVFDPCASRSVGGSFSTGKRSEALVGGLFPSASDALSIDTVLWVPCASMVSVFGWTLTIANGHITLSINLL